MHHLRQERLAEKLSTPSTLISGLRVFSLLVVDGIRPS
jgi:hypothetical protein